MQYRAFLAALVLSTAVHAGEAEESTAVQISAERMKACNEGGGCVFVTKAEVVEAMNEVFEAGKRYAHVTCASRTKAHE
jgi:hypothetical protein